MTMLIQKIGIQAANILKQMGFLASGKQAECFDGLLGHLRLSGKQPDGQRCSTYSGGGEEGRGVGWAAGAVREWKRCGGGGPGGGCDLR